MQRARIARRQALLACERVFVYPGEQQIRQFDG
jgi:hypothetical protein